MFFVVLVFSSVFFFFFDSYSVQFLVFGLLNTKNSKIK